jgi:iron complex outermembrane recepter protein
VRRSNNNFGRILQLSVLCLFLSGAALAQATLVTIHIPSEPLADALVDFALQAKLSISDSGLDFHGKVSNPVDGEFSQEEALRRLLVGTGCEFVFVESSAVRITLKSASSPAVEEIKSLAENIVVTATKREEIVQSLPYSIAVTTGSQLEDLGAQSFNDLTTQVAGLTTTNLGPGEDKVFVRGLTDSILPGLSESMVGLYLGETRIADDAPDPNLKLVDIDRIEVLRGPQGTLYGAGSLGGLVRIIPREPVQDSFQEMASISVSSTHNGGVSTGIDGMLNIPLMPNLLALRVVGYIENLSGYIDDIRLGINNANLTGRKGARFALDWQPADTWTISANLAFQTIKARDSQYYVKGLRPLERDNFLREPHSDNFLQAGITATAALGWAQLVSSTGYVNRHLKDQFDASLAWPSLTGYPLAPSPFDETRSISSFTHETRLTSTDDGKWKWLAGVFLSHRYEDFNSRLSGQDGSGINVVASAEAREDGANEIALFGEATYSFTDVLSLTAGARAYDASRDVTARITKLVTGVSKFKGSNTQSGVAPKLVVKYEPSDNMMFYAQLGEGYRLGGININEPTMATDSGESAFDSDILHNYELGSKLALLDRRIIANTAAYFAIWRNVQSDQIAPDGTFFIVNAGTVRDLGCEFDVTLIPLKHLSLQSNFFWNNAKLTHANPLLVTSEALLPGAPDISFAVSGRYDVPIADSLDASISIEYSYVGTSHVGFDELNSPPMGGYHLTNLRFGLEHDEWRGEIFVNNFMDDQSNTFAFGNPFSFGRALQITPPRPRTIGFSITWAR